MMVYNKFYIIHYSSSISGTKYISRYKKKNFYFSCTNYFMYVSHVICYI